MLMMFKFSCFIFVSLARFIKFIDLFKELAVSFPDCFNLFFTISLTAAFTFTIFFLLLTLGLFCSLFCSYSRKSVSLFV